MRLTKDQLDDCSEENEEEQKGEQWVDVSAEQDLGEDTVLEDSLCHYRELRNRYQTMVPGDVLKLLNRHSKPGAPVREPSSLLPYLVFSNLASFLHYYRLWNGNLVVGDGAMPLEEAKHTCLALLTQLLSTDSQEKVKEDSMTSAYMLDHLYYLSLFRGFQGFTAAGKPNLRQGQNIQELQALVLEDLGDILGNRSSLLDPS